MSSSFHTKYHEFNRPEARKWFARQLMLPEWMIDVPDNLSQDWYVLAIPAGKRCFVVSSDGTTVSRVRNGFILHHFPSALPGGARKKGASGPANSYSILDCIFHESDQTYYVIDMVCWRSYSLYECTADFRFFLLLSKLAEETGACDPPSYHKFRFSAVPFYNCDQNGLHSAYSQSLSYVKDGLLFYNNQDYLQEVFYALPLAMEGSNVWMVDLRRRIYNISECQIELQPLLTAIPRSCFQYMARHSPLKVEDLASALTRENQKDKTPEVDMSDCRE